MGARYDGGVRSRRPYAATTALPHDDARACANAHACRYVCAQRAPRPLRSHKEPGHGDAKRRLRRHRRHIGGYTEQGRALAVASGNHDAGRGHLQHSSQALQRRGHRFVRADGRLAPGLAPKARVDRRKRHPGQCGLRYSRRRGDGVGRRPLHRLDGGKGVHPHRRRLGKNRRARAHASIRKPGAVVRSRAVRGVWPSLVRRPGAAGRHFCVSCIRHGLPCRARPVLHPGGIRAHCIHDWHVTAVWLDEAPVVDGLRRNHADAVHRRGSIGRVHVGVQPLFRKRFASRQVRHSPGVAMGRSGHDVEPAGCDDPLHLCRFVAGGGESRRQCDGRSRRPDRGGRADRNARRLGRTKRLEHG